MAYFKKILHPELFQGNHKKNNYFEGWYYKLVSFDQKTSIAFIPGISINKKDPKNASFSPLQNHLSTRFK